MWCFLFEIVCIVNNEKELNENVKLGNCVSINFNNNMNTTRPIYTEPESGGLLGIIDYDPNNEPIWEPKSNTHWCYDCPKPNDKLKYESQPLSQEEIDQILQDAERFRLMDEQNRQNQIQNRTRNSNNGFRIDEID